MKTLIPMLLGIVGVMSAQLLGASAVAAPVPAALAQSSLGHPAQPSPWDVAPPGSLFCEDFSSGPTNDLPTPWLATQTNTWTVVAGALQARSSQPQSYSFAYLTNCWRDYSVEARICFSSTNAWGGGLAGRLNPETGSHYAVWVYPEGSPGGSNLLKLVKFQTWTNFAYRGAISTPMHQVSLSAVGTNWHTLKVVFQTNRITVAYDGTQLMSLLDAEPQPLGSGAIGLDLWTDQSPFAMGVDDVTVSRVTPPPQARNEGYWLTQNQPLEVPAPGILQNDSAGEGTNLSAVLLTGPAHGLLTLKGDGGFRYTPASSFVGTDSFTYQASNGQTNSAPATVVLVVCPNGVLFADAFSRTAPEPLAPWIAQAGNWRIGDGLLQSGTNPPESYAFAYLPANWTNYEVEAAFRFSASNAWGGGLGGRLNPATGAHYAAWVYPEESAAGSNVIRLVKFQTWQHFGYTNLESLPMRQATVSSVGTNWHALKLAFQDSQITVSYDGQPVIGMVDQEPAAYTSGAVALETWSDLKTFSFFVREVTVTPLAGIDSYAMLRQSLTVSNGLATLCWNTVAGYNYQVQYKDELNQTNWNVLEPSLAATQSTFHLTNAVSVAPQRFFRVVRLP